MNPDYKTAAVKAIETIRKYGNATNPDPIRILKKLHNVLLIPYSAELPMESAIAGDNQDAFTLVNRKESKLLYIVIYNQTLKPFQIRTALARELGHIILKHDGTSPECVWSEEANCFAYHFISPVTIPAKLRKIHYRPKRHSLLWELKGIMSFDDIELMKEYIAEEQTRIARFIGKQNEYSPDDIEFRDKCDFEQHTGWKNCYDIVLDGKTVGCCGE